MLEQINNWIGKGIDWLQAHPPYAYIFIIALLTFYLIEIIRDRDWTLMRSSRSSLFMDWLQQQSRGRQRWFYGILTTLLILYVVILFIRALV